VTTRKAAPPQDGVELMESNAADTAAPLSPEQLQARIAQLEAQLDVVRTSTRNSAADWPADPDALMDVNIPKSPTGFAVRINGNKFAGPMRIKRRQLETVLYMLSNKLRIERERLQVRGNLVGIHELDPQDVVSRVARRPAVHIEDV